MYMKKVSIIMGIYNCANTLADALDCIINQTYSNWEVIMCDDNSNDNTVEIAQKYVNLNPNKFIMLKNHRNYGLNYTLNKCLKIASGDYIARMDADDLCSKERLEKEVKILDENQEFAIVSTDMLFFDEKGVWGQTHVKKLPIEKNFIKGTPFCHAACMVRKEAYMAVNGYSISDKLLRVEDYHLWIKMYEKGFKGINIQECLYYMRDNRDAQKRKKFRYRLNESYVKKIAIKSLKLNKIYYIYCFLPIIIGLLPSKVYRMLHRKKNN